MHGMKSQKSMVGICGIATVGIVGLMTAVGCSSTSPSTGTGGTTGGSQGGKTGSQGGMTGGGTGGAAAVDAGPPLCTGVALAGAPLITDFADVTAADGGTAFMIPGKGGISLYPDGGGLTGTLTNGALAVSGTVAAGSYSGVAIYFSSCINATSYQGVRFKLTGDFGTCDMLKLGVNFPQIEPPPPASGYGVCTGATCYGPGSTYTTATTMVTFAGMSGGGAVATVIPEAQNRLTGVGFGFHGPAAGDASAGGCAVNFTIDDVTFF